MPALVCFDSAAGQRFALDVADAGRVLPLGELQPLPSPAAGVLGLLDLDGELLPVLSTLGAEGSHVLVVQAATARFGLLVGEVSAVVRVGEAELAPPPRGQERPVVRAVAGGAGGGRLLLDAAVLAGELPA